MTEALSARTIAELVQPREESEVEFWCHRMAEAGKPGTGIRGWFRNGLFWSHDNADSYAPGEVMLWGSLGPGHTSKP